MDRAQAQGVGQVWRQPGVGDGGHVGMVGSRLADSGRSATTMQLARGTGVSVTSRSPKPLRQVRFLGPPLVSASEALRPDRMRTCVREAERSGSRSVRQLLAEGLPDREMVGWRASRRTPLVAGVVLAADRSPLETCPRGVLRVSARAVSRRRLSLTVRGGAVLRVSCDLRYPRIIDDCPEAMCSRCPAAGRGSRSYSDAQAVNVTACGKLWLHAFPQHGPGASTSAPSCSSHGSRSRRPTPASSCGA